MASDAWAIVREIRARRAWTQRGLAAAAGTTPATIARIEKARMEPTVELLTRIAAAAGFELSLALNPPDPDDAKANTLARSMTDEDRLRQNERLAAMWTSAVNARG